MSISAIMAAIAALPAPYDTIVVPVRVAATLSDEIEDADLPARVLTAIGAIASRHERTLTPVGQMELRWQIDDLLLVRSVGLGRGLRDTADALARYAYDYARLLRQLRAQTYTVVSWDAQIGVITYPAGTDRQYEGVRISLTLAHIITED